MEPARRMVIGLIVLLLIGGCSRDLSKAEPFRALVGSEVTLLRDMEFHGAGTGQPVSLSPPHRIGSTPEPTIVAAAPAGTRLRIASVRAHSGILASAIVVKGTAALDEAAEEIEWTFNWGHIAGDDAWLRRAPWEDAATVPEDRRVANNGRAAAIR